MHNTAGKMIDYNIYDTEKNRHQEKLMSAALPSKVKVKITEASMCLINIMKNTNIMCSSSHVRY